MCIILPLSKELCVYYIHPTPNKRLFFLLWLSFFLIIVGTSRDTPRDTETYRHTCTHTEVVWPTMRWLFTIFPSLWLHHGIELLHYRQIAIMVKTDMQICIILSSCLSQFPFVIIENDCLKICVFFLAMSHRRIFGFKCHAL